MDSDLLLLARLIDEVNRFTFRNFSRPHPGGPYPGADTPEWMTWKTRSANLIRRVVADDSPAMTLLADGISIQTNGGTESGFELAKANILKALELARDTLLEDAFGELRGPISGSGSPALSNKVFIVHGHDDALKTDLERFLRELNLDPIVLHRQPDQGKTLIEKFEKHSDVGYAFILMTPDDIAYDSQSEALPDGSRVKERRARQNVIFEFGYFFGKLGRGRVCCLYKSGVAPPSDLAGLVYKEIDSSIEPIAFSLIKELKAAGYNIRV